MRQARVVGSVEKKVEVNMVMRKGFTEKVTLEQGPKECEEQLCSHLGARSFPSHKRASAKPCKGRRRAHLAHWRCSRSGGQRGGGPSADHVGLQGP